MFLNDWKNEGLAALKSCFEIDDAALAGAEVLLASYSYASYEGDCFVLFRRAGKLYEVNAYHCSCYGLEGKWEEEETTLEALEKRMTDGALGNGRYSGNHFAEELREVLAAVRSNAKVSGAGNEDRTD